MNIAGSVTLVTGANRGLGARLVAELLDAGAQRVHATARSPHTIDPRIAADERVVVHAMDITDQASVDAAAEIATDVTLLVNTAGVLGFGTVLDGDLGLFLRDITTNYLGTLRVTRAFVPVLEANAPAAIVNVLSMLALAPRTGMAGYCASKAAAHSLTQALRGELRGRGIKVIGAYPGPIDTDLLADVDVDKADPRTVAHRIVAGIAAGDTVIWPDEVSASAGPVYLTDPMRLEHLLTSQQVVSD